jgi:hypothetical protein
MIEDSIQALRRAARITDNEESDDNVASEKLWCVMAGNDNLIDDIAYDAISSRDRVKILFREHVTLEDERVNKKFDFIMLYGNSYIIEKLAADCKKGGGAHITITPNYIEEKPNLMIMVGPEDTIRQSVANIERARVQFGILLDDQTTGFIETDINSKVKLPKFLKNAFNPLFNVSEVVLKTILISVDKDKDVDTVQDIATSNKIFVIDFKDIDMEA